MRRTPVRSGLSLVELLVVVGIVAALVGLVLSGVQKVRASSARTQCANQMRQLALALHQYHDTRHALPPGWTSTGPDRRDHYRYVGWPARILPYVEQRALWQQVEHAYKVAPTATVWDPPHVTLAATVVPAFGCPLDERVRTTQPVYDTHHHVALTSYLGVSEHRPYRYSGVLFVDSAVKLTDITDGAANTLMIGERPPSSDNRYGWWYRGWGQRFDGSAEMILGVRETNRSIEAPYSSCPGGPYHFTPGQLANRCDAFHFWSPHPGGANFVFADGSVRFLTYSADDVFPALATRAGGETASAE